MQTLIVARHGSHKAGLLNERGRQQMIRLAERLQPILAGKSVTILSSPNTRARESTEILAKNLGMSFDTDDFLSEFSSVNDALKLIKKYQDQVDVLIIISHLEQARYVPLYFALRVWDINLEEECGIDFDASVLCGSAWVLDCKNQACTLAP